MLLENDAAIREGMDAPRHDAKGGGKKHKGDADDDEDDEEDDD